MPERGAAAAPRLVIALDYGQRRIGVACGDTLSGSARPLPTIRAGAGAATWTAIAALVRDWQPALLVVGLPYNADGTESPATAAARSFAGELGARHGLPVELVDERYSSLEAEALLRDARRRGERGRRVAKADVDAAAACIILRRWISGQS